MNQRYYEWHIKTASLLRRDAVIDLYDGRISAAMVASTYKGVSRRHAVDLSSRLPKGLIDDDRRMQLTRAGNEIVGVRSNGTYTQWELQEAIAKVATKEMKPKQAFETYGVPTSTLRRKRQGLVQMVGPDTPNIQVTKAARTIKKGSPGPKPYLGLDEEEIFLGVSDQIAAEGNPGHDASRLASGYSMHSAVPGGVSGF